MGSQTAKEVLEERVFKVLNHAKRRDMLRIIIELEYEPTQEELDAHDPSEIVAFAPETYLGGVSTKALAERMDSDSSRMGYSMKKFLECRAIRVVAEKRVRGTFCAYYRSAIREPWIYDALGVEPPSQS